MKIFLTIISFLGLALTLIPAFLVFQGMIDPVTNNYLMLLGTISWFLTAPFWMNQKSEALPVEDN